MNRRIILTASMFGAVAVMFGAFGAHSLKNVLSSDQISNWNTGIQYQFYHTFALLFLSTFGRFRTKLVDFSYICFTLGILLFSGSIYLLATRNITNIGFAHILGPITPFGGLFLIAGWVLLFFAALKHR